MRKILILMSIVLPLAGFSQVKSPTNVYFTINEIRGNADPNSTIKIDRNLGGIIGLAIISVSVNINGYFSYTFDTPLPMIAGSTPTQPIVTVWAEDNNGGQSTKVNYTGLAVSEALQNIINGTLVLPANKPLTTVHNPQINGAQHPSTTFRYKVKMLNTNFTIPLARFNFVSNNTDSRKGEILLFNSIGAGIGVSWGEIEKTTDATGTTINTDFTNTFGVHLGVLFSSGKDGTEQKNIFAPTISLSFLDFQLGVGYELGTTLDTQKKGFVTLAYAIPLSKLVKGKFYIFKASKGYNSVNPLPEIKSGTDVDASKISIKSFI